MTDYERGLADGLRKAAEVCRKAGDTFGKCDHQTGAYVCQQKILSLLPEGADQREAAAKDSAGDGNDAASQAGSQSASHQNPGEHLVCEGGCSEHSGDVGHYHVSYKGHDWGYFTYCENAVAVDRSTGHIVVSKEEHEAMLHAAQEEK